MSKRVLSMILVAVVAAGALVLWRVKDSKAKAVKRESAILKSLTPEDIVAVIKSQTLADPERTKQITGTPESRKAFLKGLTEYLALAARARREGMADNNNFRLNLKAKEKGLLADLYQANLVRDGKKPITISQESIDAVWTRPQNEQEFKAEVEALYAVQKNIAESMESKLGQQPLPQGESLEKARKAWAKAKILTDMAEADAEFMHERTTQLRLQILEAGILSTTYLAKYWSDNIRATDNEIVTYLSAHPEYDLNRKREKAELVLRRARAGEDFARLAQEFSEDRSTKNKGGLYEDFELGAGLWEEVEAAALKLEQGQIADKVIETKDGYHVVQLVDKTISKGADGKETVYLTIRHVLLQKRFEDPSPRRLSSAIPLPFKTPQEIAKVGVEQEKRQRFVDEVIRQENISLPNDFEFK